jgi:hypothetical protein
MKWMRVVPKFSSFGGKKQHYYEAETDHGKFTLFPRNGTNPRGTRTFKYKVWILWVDGRPVSGSRRYRLMDAKAFAEQHLADLAERAAQREERTR